MLSIKTFRQLPLVPLMDTFLRSSRAAGETKKYSTTVILSQTMQAAFTSPAVWTTGSVQHSGRHSSKRVWLRKSARCPLADTSQWPRSPLSPPPVGPCGLWTRTCWDRWWASYSYWPEPAVDGWEIGAIHWACVSVSMWLAPEGNQAH